MIANKNALINFSLLSCSGKKLKISRKTQGKLRGNSGNLVSQKCGHPVIVIKAATFNDSGLYHAKKTATEGGGFPMRI